MRDGSPGLVPFAAEERKRRQRAEEESARAEREKLGLLQRFLGTYERFPDNVVNYNKERSFRSVSATIFKIELGSNSDATVRETISDKTEHRGGPECERTAKRNSGIKFDAAGEFALTKEGVLVGVAVFDKPPLSSLSANSR